MSLSHAINSARTGLQTTSLRADIAATNVANASTPGYVRRSVLLGETLAGGSTAGAHVSGIARSADSALTNQRMSLSSDLAQASVMSSTWGALSARLGDSTDGIGLFSLLSDFESALSTAATSPESPASAAAVIDAANAISREFNDLSFYVQNQRAEADLEIANGVQTVNEAINRVHTLNVKLGSVDRSSSEAAALMDERQRAIDTIAEYLPVEAADRPNGAVDLVTREGVYLLAGTPREIEFSPSSAFGANQTITGGQLSGMTVDGVELTPGASTYSAVSSGLFSALFTLRDNDLPKVSAQLDTVANDLITRLSDDAIDPTKTPGEFGLFVDANPAGGAGIAGRIRVNPLVDPSQGGEISRLRDGLGAVTTGPTGDNTILSALYEATTATNAINANGLQGMFSVADLAADLASQTGRSRISKETILTSTSAQHTIMMNAEMSKTGVDIDDQMQQLLLIEQAYAANARVIEAANQMIQRLMEL
ncbi:flagellar hook-associated protein FlgK [Henriciella sp. AS95]|uniref:flagellar hook-associated protein FlgK n=1 Tax=Henriciella sp. AS95 TaxID=3135782 RepID=UPI003170AADB